MHPYESLEDLPYLVKDILPEHAQEIYRAAYNSAWGEYADPGKRQGDESRETVARKVAWSAVEQKYKKDEKTGRWVKKEEE